MKLGVLLAGRSPEEISARFEQARDAGFFVCQLNLCHSGFSRPDLVNVADAAVSLGVRPAAVGCYVNPLSPNSAMAMGATRDDLDLVLHSLDILGARRVVLWSGTHADHPYDDHPDNAAGDVTVALREFVTDVVYNTRARHYYLCIEPWRTHVLRDEESVLAFHDTLEPRVQERVRYVLDATSLMSPSREGGCDAQAASICRDLGPVTGLVHLRDVVPSAEVDASEPSIVGPCQGKLDYAAYVRAILENVDPDVTAIVRNVAIPEFADARDRLLRLSDRWELI